jgi:hypothetical protein
MKTKALFTASAMALAGCSQQDSCFGRSTLISTPRGKRPLGELTIGDEVWSFDPSSRSFAIGRIAHVHRARGLVRTLRATGVTIASATASHPIFCVSANAFVREPRTVVSWDDRHTLREARVQAVEVLGEQDVFNLTVDGAFSTYFADGVLVHNKSIEPDMCTGEFIRLDMVDQDRVLCVGDITRLRWTNELVVFNCTTQDELRRRLTFATSDPSVLIVEDIDVRAVSSGTARITLLLDGAPRSQLAVTVRECVSDAGSDDAADVRGD